MLDNLDDDICPDTMRAEYETKIDKLQRDKDRWQEVAVSLADILAASAEMLLGRASTSGVEARRQLAITRTCLDSLQSGSPVVSMSNRGKDVVIERLRDALARYSKED